MTVIAYVTPAGWVQVNDANSASYVTSEGWVQVTGTGTGDLDLAITGTPSTVGQGSPTTGRSIPL